MKYWSRTDEKRITRNENQMEKLLKPNGLFTPRQLKLKPNQTQVIRDKLSFYFRRFYSYNLYCCHSLTAADRYGNFSLFPLLFDVVIFLSLFSFFETILFFTNTFFSQSIQHLCTRHSFLKGKLYNLNSPFSLISKH